MSCCWKQMLVIFSCFVCAIAPLVTGYAQASAAEGYGTYLHRSFPFGLGEQPNTLRHQPENQGEGHLALGFWGGEHISLEVTADGAKAEYDCAHGTISQRVTLDRRGRFTVPGSYVAEHGGPVREGEQADSIPVQFTGRVSDKRIYLTVKRRGSGQLIGNFTLVFGQEASLVKCR
jgi:hypothetical protein